MRRNIVIGLFAILFGAFLVFCLITASIYFFQPLGSRQSDGDLHFDVPSTALSVVEKAVNSLEWGNIAFDAPKRMKIAEAKSIELLLSPKKSIQELQSSLNSSEKNDSARIRISNRMVANLSGTGFKIEAIVPQEQAVYRGETTQWKWEVTPTKESRKNNLSKFFREISLLRGFCTLKSMSYKSETPKDGKQTIYLTLSAIINVSEKEVPLVVRTFENTIEVDISTNKLISTFIEGNWQWLWASILVPLSPFLWNWYQKKREKKQPPNTPGA